MRQQLKEDRTLCLWIGILTLVRVWLGLKATISFNISTPHDEALMVGYAILPQHFGDAGNIMAMAKNMGFPLFLDFVHFTGLSYSLVMTLIWVLCAFLAIVLVRKFIGRTRGFTVLIFAFLLFLPCAFDNLVGTRLYRNAILAPATLLFFLLLALLMVYSHEMLAGKRTWRWPLGLSVILGIVFSWEYYISENGAWLWLPLGAVILAILCMAIRMKTGFRKKSLLRALALCAIPVLLFAGATETYKAVNHHFFGVYEINTRIDGELGGFVNRVYRIDSQDRTRLVWAPAGAIDQAFAASETLSSHPELKRAIVDENPWYGDIRTNPIPGDFLGWCLIVSTQQAGLWESHAQVSAFYAGVNAELDAAFAEGRLAEAAGLRLSSSSISKTPAEIAALWPLVRTGLQSAIAYKGYMVSYTAGNLADVAAEIDAAPNSAVYGDYVSILPASLKGEYLTNMPLNGAPYVGFFRQERIGVDLVMAGIIWVYQAIGIPVFVLGAIGFLLLIVRACRKDRRDASLFMRLLFMAAMLLTALGVLVGIAWFVDYLAAPVGPYDPVVQMKYYAVAAVPCFVLFEIFGLSALYEAIRGAKNR